MNLNYVPNEKQKWVDCTKRVVLKNAFGFGGTNASICISEYSEK
jgi:3-oxoacyl-[acyl-carrier-protein] synthase II